MVNAAVMVIILSESNLIIKILAHSKSGKSHWASNYD
jgi:hypothetical protein